MPKKLTAAYKKAAKSGAKKLYKAGKFGKRLPPPVAKSLFSFASLRPGAKKNPFTYGAKVISQRLGKIVHTLLNFTNQQKEPDFVRLTG